MPLSCENRALTDPEFAYLAPQCRIELSIAPHCGAAYHHETYIRDSLHYGRRRAHENVLTLPWLQPSHNCRKRSVLGNSNLCADSRAVTGGKLVQRMRRIYQANRTLPCKRLLQER